MSVLAGQGGRGLRDRVTYGGTSPCESSYSRSARVACRPRQLDTSEAVEEGRTDLVGAKLARADVPIFLRGLDDACRGRQHEFHTLREPSVRVSRFLSLFGFASVLPTAS